MKSKALPNKDGEEISPKVLKLMVVIKLPKRFNYKKALTEALIERYQ